MLQRLKSFDADKHDLDELVALKAFGDSLATTYGELEMEAPEWLRDSNTALSREIKARTADMLEKELRETESRLDALKTAPERRAELNEKANRLRKKLGLKTGVKAA